MTDPSTKRFPTLAVAGAYTGMLLAEGKFGDIHEVFDHLFPGIMTLGLSAMAETASTEIARQLPELAALGKPDDWLAYAAMVERVLRSTLPVAGPMRVEREVIDQAFDAMRERISSK